MTSQNVEQRQPGAGTGIVRVAVQKSRGRRLASALVPSAPASAAGQHAAHIQAARPLPARLEEFIRQEVPRLVSLQLPYLPLTYILLNQRMLIDGLWLEFGVWKGDSINKIAQFTDKKIFGFDSFTGLPEDWREGKTQGRYDVGGMLPEVRDNVELFAGWFADTLPAFLEKHPGNVALLHVDCDIYNSTKTVLTLLRERIVPGTVIVFDELFNYPEYRDHEIKAFYEFLAETGAGFEWIGIKGPIELEPDEDFEHWYYEQYRGTGVRITSMPGESRGTGTFFGQRIDSQSKSLRPKNEPVPEA